jgi:hypothetical protein
MFGLSYDEVYLDSENQENRNDIYHRLKLLNFDTTRSIRTAMECVKVSLHCVPPFLYRSQENNLIFAVIRKCRIDYYCTHQLMLRYALRFVTIDWPEKAW